MSDVQIALLEKTAEDHDARIVKVEDAVMKLGEMATGLKVFRWILLLFLSAWPLLLWLLTRSGT